MTVYGSYVAVAGIGGALSAVIGIVALKILTQITDTGMIAIAFMSMAPAAMAVGIAFFIHRTHLAAIGQLRDGTHAGAPIPPSPPPYPDGGYTAPWRADR